MNNEPENRPTLIRLLRVLRRLQINARTNNYEAEHEMSSHKIQHFNDIDEKNLSSLIDGLVDIYFEKMNEGNEKYVLKKYVFDYFDHYKINLLQEVYH